MNVDLSNKMATQSWQPQSVQTPSSGQPSMAGPQGQRQSSTSANQSQGMASSNYNASPSVPSSPSNIVPPQFRSNTDSLNPSQSSSVPTGTSLPQAASPVSVSGYSSQPPLYTGARWPPPSPGHSPLPVPPSSGPQSISSVHNSQSSTVQQHAAIGTVQGPSGQSVPPVPSWQTQHAPSPVAPVSSGPPPSCSSSASQESSAVNCHPVSSFSPSLTAATTQTVSSGLAVPSVSLGSPLPAISAPPGLAPLSVSQVPVKVAAQPSTTGTPAQPGGASVVNVLSSMTNSSVVTGPSGPPAVQETSGSSAATPVKMTPATTSNPANLLVPPAVGSAPPGPPGISLTAHPASLTGAHQPPVDIARPGLLPSAIPTSAALPGAGSISTPSMPQQQQYVPYINVLPVPQLLPWAQGQPRPFPPFVNVPNPYLPPIRPVVPVVANSSMTKTSSDSTTPLAPPGEQETTVKASAPEGDKVLSVSSLSGQVVNGQPTPNTSNTISISSNVTESALGSELSSKVMEVADVWTAHRTLEGNVYYYNSVTGESTYEKPAGFHGEVDKVAAQPTPVSWESVGETGWVLVTTNDAKKYYFHKDTKATSWQVPAEVVEYRKKQIEEASLKISVGGEHVKPNSDKSTVSFSLTVPNVGNTTQKPAASAASSSALDLIKKKLQDSGLIASENIGSTDGNAGKTLISEGGKEKAKDNHAEKSSSESSSDSDDDEQGPTKEERILQFKEMLKEKGIAPFSKWEKELPKIIFDPRFKAIASHTERRSIFDHYVRTRAEEERKEKRALQKAAVEGFKQLLEEASKDINHNTEYEKFARKWAGDRRFEALERKDREALLNERVLPLRKAEEERIRAIQSAAAAGFKTMLAELGEITSSTRWSKVKDRLRNDPRYRTIMREEREAIFNAYVGELRAAELEAERAAKAKREEEEKRKEREREKRKRKEREEQEWEKARAKALKREATTGFQALLTERVKDPEASWTETRPKLEKDPLGRAMNPELDNIERERLFREHIKALYERALRDYRALLADVLATDLASKQNEEGKSMLNSWSEAKKHLKSDTRYAKMPRGDREAWWRRYAEDVSRKLKAGSNSSKEEKRSITEAGKATGLDGVWRNPGHR